jgi:polyhydroxybutyrate depolymerase
VPLILNFHGLGSNSFQQEIYSGFATLSDQPEGGFIVVSPQGTLLGSTNFWNTTLLAGLVDDVAFVDELLDDLEANFCIDASRIFSAGMSNGAQMSIRMACSLSSRIAAIAPVAGAYYPAMSNTVNPDETCPDTRAVPVIAFHGTADNTVPFNGGDGLGTIVFRLPLDNTTPDEDVIEDWAIHNGCTSGRQETPVTASVRLVTYDGCTDGATAQLYIVDGGGHSWPGAFGSGEISATDLAWAFFQAHPLPGGKPTPPPSKDGASDADGDGCTGAQELGPTLSLGGQRHPKVFWDFFDTPTPPSFTRDSAVAVSDIAGVVGRFGSGGLTNIDPLSTPAAAPAYHTGYDRTAGPVTGTTGPPNGSVTVQDISLAVAQFGHSCL